MEAALCVNPISAFVAFEPRVILFVGFDWSVYAAKVLTLALVISSTYLLCNRCTEHHLDCAQTDLPAKFL